MIRQQSGGAYLGPKDGVVMTLIKGAFIGVANIIPGVSGGTFALILGIFDRMIHALNSLGLGTLKVTWRLFKSGFKAAERRAFVEEMKRADLGFMVSLTVGAGVTLGSCSFLIKFLLAHHVTPTLAFFIGLILPSIAVPWAYMEKRGLRLLWVIPGIALTMGISAVMPDNATGLDNPLMAFLAGAVAVSAMILPGISGSYVLLVMGQYQNMLEKLTDFIKSLDLIAGLWLGAMAIGVVVGILLFAKLLHFLLKHFQSATMAFLIGLLLGSLWILWPYKSVDEGAAIVGRSGEVKEDVKIATAPNRLPQTWEEGLWGAGAMALGFVGAAGLIAMGRRKEEEEPEDENQ